MSIKRMKQAGVLAILLLLGVWLISRPVGIPAESAARQQALRQSMAPVGADVAQAATDYSQAPISPVVVNVADIPVGVYDPNNLYDRWQRGEADLDENEFRVSPAEAAALQADAMKLSPNANIQIAQSGPGLNAPTPGVAFDSLDTTECCGGGAVVPPDPIMAAGPNHLVAIVNLAFEMYDKTGANLSGPTTMASFFASVGTGCASNPFDPNVLYDEEADRWIIAADGNGTHYCIAVSQTPDPTGSYNIYSIPAQPVGGEFHDYPHTGVGDTYIVAGANQFGGAIPGGFEGRVWAMDKNVMYSGGALTPVTFSTGGTEGTPQPLHLHGYGQGTWPSMGSTHYFATDPYDGCTVNIWQWNIPATPTIVSTYDLCAATGVSGGFPVNFPQSGGNTIQANDWRMREFEYRNGYGWIADSISCNPGGGTVDCVRWHQVDLTGTPTLAQAGVYASTGQYRTFPDLAVNHCDDMVVGYTKSSSSMFPSVWYTGRESVDAPGTLQAEAELKAGEVTYTAFDTPPHRWGDYTGMTIDPDGLTFWYLGQYSKNIAGNARWGNYIGSFTYPNCTAGGGNPEITLTKTVGTDSAVCATTDVITVTAGTEVTYCYEVENIGDVTLNVHDLVDSELGTILNDFAFTLAPSATVFLTQTTTLLTATVNTATWTAFNPAGYTYDDTAAYNFIDISGTGTPLNLTDDGEANVTMPFQFTFYGVTSDLVRIGNNGGMLFATTTGDVGFTNAALPNAAHPLAIFPFWDDLDEETGNVYYETQGSAPNRMFIVQWDDRPHFPGPGPGGVTFQVIMYEGSNEILFQYADVVFGDAAWDYGASATVGLNEDGSSANQYSFNTPSLSDGLAISWTPSVPATASASDTATVIVLVPEIAVDPAELVVSQPVTSVVSYPLTISNVGNGLLEWDIFEENPTQPPPVAPNSNADPSLAREVAGPTKQAAPNGDAPSLTDWNWPEAILYDNGPLVTHPGGGFGGADASVLQTNLGLTTFGYGHALTSGFRVADDFTIADGGWFIDTITFFAYQTGSSTVPTIDHVNLRIWDGPPGDPGSNVVFGDTTTNRLASTSWANMYRVTDTDMMGSTRPVMGNVVTIGIFLPAGTYWLDWQTGGTLASGPWVPPVSILGEPGKPGANGLQFDPGASTWNPLVDVAPQDLPFIIEGQVAGAVCQTPADIPWLSVNPTSGSTPGGESSDVMVTMDTTGLMVGGVYTGTLCINSNDPVTPLVTVPVTLTVIAQSFGVELTADDATGVGAPGDVVTYTLQITNTGNVEDTFDLTASGSWAATLSDTSVTLGAGESATVTVSVTIPPGTADGDSDVTTVTATSTNDPSVSDSVTLTTTAEVGMYYLYLPIILKP
jgi:hypothetical protein